MMIFFFRKNVIILFRLNFSFFAVLLLVYFCNQFIFFVERKANSTIEQQKVKGHEKPDGLLVSKMVFSF